MDRVDEVIVKSTSVGSLEGLALGLLGGSIVGANVGHQFDLEEVSFGAAYGSNPTPRSRFLSLQPILLRDFSPVGPQRAALLHRLQGGEEAITLAGILQALLRCDQAPCIVCPARSGAGWPGGPAR